MFVRLMTLNDVRPAPPFPYTSGKRYATSTLLRHSIPRTAIFRAQHPDVEEVLVCGYMRTRRVRTEYHPGRAEESSSGIQRKS
ncbi:hypothetical protein HO173_002456 [Letharia columbiana]|uniref:Uncharacterized protein n=1 Tax=Letharia columbiana TaxID=112416 RepID=A0A8H6G277_9LECA|nr:uncharacterized protein HO173_002456 [Letharia columbiana]KAF6239195.1 hypothetical protein HO173_002456 [Letharia columbiana]